jgi:hypothetical protein
METKTYSIIWLDVSKKSLLWDDFEFSSKNESPFVSMPIFMTEDYYKVEYNWKEYLCNEKNISKFHFFLTSDDIKWIPEGFLVIDNNLLFWILLQNDFNEVNNPYEIMFFIRSFLDLFTSKIKIDIEDWFELMLVIITWFYWVNSGLIFYHNFSNLIYPPSKSLDEIFEQGANNFKEMNLRE